MHYTCSECGRPVGFMGNKFGTPERYKCPWTGRVAHVQTPVRRDTAPSPAFLSDVLIPQKIRHDDDD